jgi:hypothetical protein
MVVVVNAAGSKASSISRSKSALPVGIGDVIAPLTASTTSPDGAGRSADAAPAKSAATAARNAVLKCVVM